MDADDLYSEIDEAIDKAIEEKRISEDNALSLKSEIRKVLFGCGG